MDYIEDRIKNSNIIIYTTEDGLSKIETTFDGNTAWLSKAQMAELFRRDRLVMSKHIKNVFKEGELPKESNVQILHVANSDKPVEFSNLYVMRLKIWKFMLPVLTMIRKLKYPFSFFRRFRIKFIMLFMGRRQRKLSTQG